MEGNVSNNDVTPNDVDLTKYLFSTTISNSSTYHGNELVFWGIATIMILIGFIAAVSNGLVLYITAYHKNQGPLKSFDSIIKSLAVADMLFGIIGIPSRLLSAYYKGK